MSWLLNLYKTYEQNESKVGRVETKVNGRQYALLPVSHTTQYAQVEIVVDEFGNFYSAKVVGVEEQETVIPCTEASFSRTSSPVPHPLHDGLKYVAGDFQAYGGTYKNDNPFDLYLSQLKEWIDSGYRHPKIEAIYRYVEKGNIIKDLVQVAILHADENNHLIMKWTKPIETKYGEKPEIFKLINDTQDKVFVRFDVHHKNQINTKIWNDKTVYQSFIDHYRASLGTIDLCYISGELKPKTEKHASKIRNSADKAKLISANDSAGFTYRGRFLEGNDVANISYDISQKAHNALKWLISKQGQTIDNRVFLVWGNDELKVPSPQSDKFTLLEELGFTNVVEEKEEAITHEVFAKKFNTALLGYKQNLTMGASEVNILILDAATTGRLAVLYYRNLSKERYLDNLEYWQQTCSWLHRYRKDDQKRVVEFVGAPALRDIAEVAYGTRASDKLKKNAIERLYPCVIDRTKIPLDIVRSVFYRASNPVALENWEWQKVLSIACALINKQHEKEAYNMALDSENKNRDYLFGRLLAIADVLERNALPVGDKRASNAIRYMNVFAKHPARTWATIQANLQPYQARLGEKATYHNRLIDEVASQIEIEDFNNKPLSGIYLLGFYSQRRDLYKSKIERDAEDKNLNGDE